MFKKIITIAVLATVIVASIATMCLATNHIQSSGITHGYNGSYYYDQGWVKFNAFDDAYNVTVGVVKTSGTYGKKTTHVNNGSTKKCYSYQVQGSDGITAWIQYVED